MVGTFRVEPSGVVKGNIWESIRENFFCHMLLKYRVLSRVTWLRDDPVLSNVIPCTSPSAWKRDKGRRHMQSYMPRCKGHVHVTK